MECQKCGTVLPDQSVFCPNCGESVSRTQSTVNESAVPGNNLPEMTAVPNGGETKSGSTTASAGVFAEVPEFFRLFFKNPIEAVAKFGTAKYWIWGLLVAVTYIGLDFLFSFASIVKDPYGNITIFSQVLARFGYMIGTASIFAALIFVYFLMQKALKFKEQKDLKSVIAVTGLAFWIYIPVVLINRILGIIMNFSGISTALSYAVFTLAAIVLFEENLTFTKKENPVRSMLLVLCAIASMPVLDSLIQLIVNVILYR